MLFEPGVRHVSLSASADGNSASDEAIGDIHTGPCDPGWDGMSLIFPGDKLLVAPSIWSVLSGRRVCTLLARMPLAWEVSPDGQTIATLGRDDFHLSVSVWDANSCERLYELRSRPGRSSGDVAFFDGGASLAVLWGRRSVQWL